MSNKFTYDSSSKSIFLIGKLDSESINYFVNEFILFLEENTHQDITIDCSGITYCDTIGSSFFIKIDQLSKENNFNYKLVDLDEKFSNLLSLFKYEPTVKQEEVEKINLIEKLGSETYKLFNDLYENIVFTGSLCISLFQSLLNIKKIRWKDVAITSEKVGVNAIGIIALVNFLVGLVISFQSAIPLEKYGGTLFVADLLVLSTFRELGPLMTAIVVNGRTGSAFAAEIGTMKVNEEIDALSTMGIDPVKFLVVPKILASLITIPILTIFGNLFALLGGLIVMLALGFPPVAYLNEMVLAANYGDLLGGLFKSLFFALTIASVGCLEGLKTQKGPAAVGDSTTSSVVRGLVMIIVLDGIFGVLYFYLGI